jgi:hypothetical protein
MAQPSDRRKVPRSAVNCPAQIIEANGAIRQALIVDRSGDCFGVSGENNYRPGEFMVLDIQYVGTFDCEIIWANEKRFGVRIQTDLKERDIAALAHFLEFAVRSSTPKPP